MSTKKNEDCRPPIKPIRVVRRGEGMEKLVNMKKASFWEAFFMLIDDLFIQL